MIRNMKWEVEKMGNNGIPQNSLINPSNFDNFKPKAQWRLSLANGEFYKYNHDLLEL